MGEALHHKQWWNRNNSPPRGGVRGGAEVGYGDIGPPAGPNTVLLIHSDGIKSSTDYAAHHDWRSRGSDWPDIYDCVGRVDIARKVGSLALESGLGRRKARRIVENAIKAFPGVRFRVFPDNTAGGTVDLTGSVSVQEFWESTE